MELVSPINDPNVAWVYTDGACSGNPGIGGWAFYLAVQLEGGLKVFHAADFEEETTNNKMEMKAVLKALNFLESKGHVSNVVVFTDSSYVANGLQSWIWGWIKNSWKKKDGSEVANEKLWKALHQQKGRFENVILEVVPGHSAVAGNEHVDMMAVEAYTKKRFVKAVEVPMGDEHMAEAFMSVPKLRKHMESSSSKKSSSKKKALYYLSYLNGELQKHQTWAECEARVKGASGARFKKVCSPDEEAEILSSWGIQS